MHTGANWNLHHRYLEGIASVFRLYQASDRETMAFVAATLLVGNGTTLLKGAYGTGKTQLVHLLRKVFFATGDASTYDFGCVTCTQDLQPMDMLFCIDLGRLTQGEEVVTPRELVTSRLKFINEVQRANPVSYNGLLSLLAERQVVYRDQVFASPPYACIMDANPHDAGSAEIPQAFFDRIDFSYDMPLQDFTGVVRWQRNLATKGGMHWGMLADLAEPQLTGAQMDEIWQDVGRIAVPEAINCLAALIAAHFQKCSQVTRENVSPDYELPCRKCSYMSEVCAKLKTVPGSRFIASSMRLAQARAWLRRSSEVTAEDLLYGLPYTLGHRLEIREETTRLFPNTRQWLQEAVYRNGLRPKIPRWQEAIETVLAGNGQSGSPPWLTELASRDLALKELLQAAPTIDKKATDQDGPQTGINKTPAGVCRPTATVGNTDSLLLGTGLSAEPRG